MGFVSFLGLHGIFNDLARCSLDSKSYASRIDFSVSDFRRTSDNMRNGSAIGDKNLSSSISISNVQLK